MDIEAKFREDFEKYVSIEDGCWLWQGPRRNRKGKPVGYVHLNGRSYDAYRLAYQLFAGDLADGEHLHHTCANLLCVNPLHLYSKKLPGWFWRNVQPNGECWDWQGTVSTSGYGAIFASGRKEYTHRYAFELFTGKPVPDGTIVRHKCDRKLCVNPAHLEVGDHQDNANDAVSRNRVCRGERSPGARLTEAAVREIRRLRAQEGATASLLAQMYEVSKSTIEGCLSGRTWRHVAA